MCNQCLLKYCKYSKERSHNLHSSSSMAAAIILENKNIVLNCKKTCCIVKHQKTHCNVSHFKNWNFWLLLKSWKIWCFWARLPSWPHPKMEHDCTCIRHRATVSSLSRCLTLGLLHMVPWNWKASRHSPFTAYLKSGSFSASKIIRFLLEL